jgi:hypothetical protein
LVRPGGLVPVDGVVMGGESFAFCSIRFDTSRFGARLRRHSVVARLFAAIRRWFAEHSDWDLSNQPASFTEISERVVTVKVSANHTVKETCTKS